MNVLMEQRMCMVPLGTQRRSAACRPVRTSVVQLVLLRRKIQTRPFLEVVVTQRLVARLGVVTIPALQGTGALEMLLPYLTQNSVARLVLAMVVRFVVQTAASANSAKPVSDSIQYPKLVRLVLASVQVVKKMHLHAILAYQDTISANPMEVVFHVRTKIASRALLIS